MTISQDLFAKAGKVIPGGVNSPVRACASVGVDPLFIESANGATITDADGTTYTDYVMSWGPMLLGHNDATVRSAVWDAADKGLSFGAPCADEVRLAERICELVPSMEMVRMVNSGTEATMSALRLARGYTGRDKIIKFEGCYHGHSDALLASAGSGVATLSIPGTPGVPAETVAHTLIAPYNDLTATRALFEAHPDQVAALIVEPIAGNMGLVLPEAGFLQGLRELCDEFGALLIFDEVISGFRAALGGAQEAFGVKPDLTCLGKIIGGGMPVGAYGGRADVMGRIAPCGDVYQAGTLSGNPVAMAAGLATLGELAKKDYAQLAERTANLAGELAVILAGKGLPVQVNHFGSLFTLFFCEGTVTDFASAKKTNTETFAKLFGAMREAGVNMPPSNFECWFTSFAHSAEAMEATLAAARKAAL